MHAVISCLPRGTCPFCSMLLSRCFSGSCEFHRRRFLRMLCISQCLIMARPTICTTADLLDALARSNWSNRITALYHRGSPTRRPSQSPVGTCRRYPHHGACLSQERRVLMKGRPPLPYDVLSIDVGISPSTGGIPGVSQHATPVKPVSKCAPAGTQERA